jgi:hypothetical protein
VPKICAYRDSQADRHPGESRVALRLHGMTKLLSAPDKVLTALPLQLPDQFRQIFFAHLIQLVMQRHDLELSALCIKRTKTR